MSFCPVCGAHHDPKMPCADRAGELLRDVGVKAKPMAKKELKKTIKKANRGLVVILIVVLAFCLLIFLLPYFNSFRIDRRTARADIESGAAWWDKGDYDRAIADFTEAIESKQLLAKELAIAYYDRGRTWYEKDDHDKAIADFTQAIRLDPLSSNYYARGVTLDLKGDYDKAIADFNEAIRIHPQYAAAYMTRGIARFNKGEFSSAAADLAQSQQINADTYAAIWLYLARAHSSVDGKTELRLNTHSTDRKKWPAPVVAFYLGEGNPSIVTSLTADPDPKKHKEQLCEANYFLGEWHLMRNEKQKARTLFTNAQNDCPKNSFEYIGALLELQRLM